jgi:thymidine kinase
VLRQNRGHGQALLPLLHDERGQIDPASASLLQLHRTGDADLPPDREFRRPGGQGQIASRIGIAAEADTYTQSDDLFAKIEARLAEGPCACVLVDEAQWMTRDQVWQLARVVDDLRVPVMCYGLRVDFRGELFPGSAALLALADEMREVRTICHCGKKATMVIRVDADGKALTEGAQIEVGGNDRYISLCRRHFREAIGDRPS